MSNAGLIGFSNHSDGFFQFGKQPGLCAFGQAKGRGRKARHDVKHRDMQVCFY